MLPTNLCIFLRRIGNKIMQKEFVLFPIMYYLNARRSSLSDIKCEAQADRFISDNAQLQVL